MPYMTATAQRRPRLATRARTSPGRRADTRLPLDLHNRLAALAAANDRSLAAEARVAIARHVDREMGRAEP